MNLTTVFTIISFIVEHREDIKKMIMALEQLVGEIPGSQKAQVVKDFIAKALSIEGQLEAAWPMVAPFFNLFVAAVKKPA